MRQVLSRCRVSPIATDSREAVGRADNRLRQAGSVGGVARVVDDHQLGARPDTAQFPGVRDGRLEVETPIHQDAGDLASASAPRIRMPSSSQALWLI